MSQEKNEQTFTGYLGKNPEHKRVEQFDSNVFNSSFKPIAKKGEETKWMDITAWKDNADRLQKGVEDGITKLTLTGKVETKSFTNQKGEEKTRDVLKVSSIKKHKDFEIEGEIKKVEDKKTPKDTPYKELFVVSPSQEKFNVNVFEDKANIAEGLKLEPGQQVGLKGQGTILEYKKDGEDVSSTHITSWDLAPDLNTLKDQIEKNKEQRLNNLDQASEKVDKAIGDIKNVNSPSKEPQKQTQASTSGMTI